MTFPATRLSVVEALRSPDPAQRAIGLEALAEAYWAPVLAYVKLRFRLADEDARDLTQDLFTRILEKSLASDYDPSRARLRTFLRTLVDRLAIDRFRAAARRNEGGRADEAFDETIAESALSPEEVFERAWRRDVLTRSIAALERSCAEGGHSERFEVFAARDLADTPPSYDELATRFGLKTTDVTNHLSFCRRELRRLALELLGRASGSEAERREDARSLFGR